VIGTDHLQMSGALLGQLHTDLDDGLAVDSIGGVANLIITVGDVNSNVVVTGNQFLEFGDDGAGQAYAFAGGVIDASTDTGGVLAFLAAGGTAQTFIGGSGNDTGVFLGNANDTVNLAGGGDDKVPVSFGKHRWNAKSRPHRQQLQSRAQLGRPRHCPDRYSVRRHHPDAA
jgi:hypothetical protein